MALQASPSPCSQRVAANGWVCIIDLVCNGVSYDVMSFYILFVFCHSFKCYFKCYSAIDTEGLQYFVLHEQNIEGLQCIFSS